MPDLTFRTATAVDLEALAQMNHRLIRDEGHHNRMTADQLRERMAGFLADGYTAIIFDEAAPTVAYALFRPTDDGTYLRQLYVEREHRRRGVGRAAMRLLLDRVIPPGRITLDVLSGNAAARAFYASLGFVDYCVTMERRDG